MRQFDDQGNRINQTKYGNMSQYGNIDQTNAVITTQFNNMNQYNYEKQIHDENVKFGFGDVIFFVLAIGLLIFLVPFYPSLLTLVKLAVDANVGKDVYISVLALFVSIVIMFIGFKYRNLLTKLVALGLIAFFTTMPFRHYLEKKSLFSDTLSNYEFRGLEVVPPETCESQQEMVEEFNKKIEEQMGDTIGSDWSMAVENRPMPDENATFKDKLMCMPSSTTYRYSIGYKDAYGESRIVYYTTEIDYLRTLKETAFSIGFDKLIGLFNEHGHDRVEYKINIVAGGYKTIELNRQTIHSENVKLLGPTEIKLETFFQDNRLILELNFGASSTRNKMYEAVDKLIEISDYPLNIVMKHSEGAEYYIGSEQFNGTYEEFLIRVNKNT